jgi:transcriptional regulator with XRE-family HTH domain
MLKKLDYGEKITMIAKALRITHYQLGQDMDIKPPTMQSYVDKGVTPNLDFFRKLLKAVPNLNAEWFFLDKGNILNQDAETQQKEKMYAMSRELDLLKRIDELTRKNESIEKELEAMKSPGKSVSSRIKLNV